MSGIVFKVEGMKCGGCKSKIEGALKNMDSGIETLVNLEDKTVKVTFEDLSPLEIKKTIEEAGFNVTGMNAE
ncbi:MAG: copper chaperone [Deltaproteobacteria bacterium]|nr:MAG: copper chaperone [Deltaproteobacteria bacterium]TNF25724.1 MAG: copper chaperone [Deltaproteobacteria bacterium]